MDSYEIGDGVLIETDDKRVVEISDGVSIEGGYKVSVKTGDIEICDKSIQVMVTMVIEVHDKVSVEIYRQ